MKKIILSLYILLFILTIVSCTSNNQPTTKEIAVDIDMPALSDSLMSTRFGNGHIVVLKGVMINKVDRILLWGDNYVILDKNQQTVNIFDSQGNIIKQIMQIGRGPGEYVQIQDCAIDNLNNILMIYADQPGKILLFDSQGQYLRKVEMKSCFYEISTLKDKMFGYNCSPEKNGNDLVKEFTIPNFAQSTSGARSEKGVIDFNSGKIFFSDLKQTWMSPPGQPYLYTYNSDINDFSAKYFVNYGKNQIPNDFKLNADEPILSIQNAIKNNIVLHTSDICELGNYLLFKANNRSFMLNMITNEVSRIGYLAAPAGIKAIKPSPLYIPMGNQNSKYVTQISATLLMDCQKKMEGKTMMFDEATLQLSRSNAEFANPVLVIYEIAK
ncbi:hypothetical protein BN938_2679 [Mucinivorans hirudinis]|uniref:6-bladed beta-propeller n=1 Tax=Mucinivorans hirudinis TaxID=1433126 RepID=A0A060RE33_9BACT|nr:hypothetical protein BN938_2679 [Mucinivorans hirudinis]